MAPVHVMVFLSQKPSTEYGMFRVRLGKGKGVLVKAEPSSARDGANGVLLPTSHPVRPCHAMPAPPTPSSLEAFTLDSCPGAFLGPVFHILRAI